MKREDYIHFHGLLVLIKDYLEEEEGRRVETPEYDEIDDEIHEIALHKTKPEHKDAVFALINDIAESENIDIEKSLEV